MEYRGYTPYEVNKDKRKNMVGIVVLFIHILIGAIVLIGTIFSNASIKVFDASEFSYKDFSKSEVYYFEEMVVLDTYAYYGDTTTGYADMNYYIVSFEDKDGNNVYMSLRTEKSSEIEKKLQEYLNNDSLVPGDFAVSGCFSFGYENGGTVSDYFVDAYELYNSEMPGEKLDWTFFYKAETIEEYESKEASQPYILFAIAALFIIGPVIGIILLIRKRKELNRYIEEYNNTPADL